MALSDFIITDDLTVVLGLVAICLFLLHNLYKPQSLVHPILLGRQSDVARVRNPGESATYRNYSTGMMGRFPARPTKDQHCILDLVRPDADAPRTLWSTKITNPELRERVSSFANGLVRYAGLVPQESNVLLLLNDSIEFIISDLALASASLPSFLLTSLRLLSPLLESHPPTAIVTHADMLPSLLEVIYDSHESGHHTIIVVGNFDNSVAASVGHVRLLRWESVEREGAQGDKLILPDLHPQDIFSVSFFEGLSGELEGTQLTHENLTAGVASVRALLPLSSAMSPLDTLISAFPLNTPYGRAVAYTAIYEGTSFATLDSTKLISSGGAAATALADLASANSFPIPSPTILFIKPSHLNSLSSEIIDKAKASSPLLYHLGWRHKLSGILEGFITKRSLWDRLVFDSARVNVMDKGAGTVRGVIVGGEPLEAQTLVLCRIALSVPLVNAYIHPLVTGPVFASHPLDLQTFPSAVSSSSSAADAYTFSYLAPVGPPSVNVEVKLRGVDDSAVEAGADPCGALFAAGPVVGTLLRLQDNQDEYELGWVELGERAKVATNGTFKVVEDKGRK
ncbi:acetyl-CoA synthetase-like protein [Sparassis crispa]|uniref:Acetyl-CoA synthetase-like protein n=1 Tax=Sparassis crispa TaxID=139825 RepID=A0A401GJR1_9APHY|nr:acetyl-CoA synthetase-like protein [Sparassis crispa]GBE82392.1 acetyl-CoA synthetase-like protein [Sparassis crispa]